MDFCSRQLRLQVLLFVTMISRNLAVSLCSTATWDRNAVTVAGDPSGTSGTAASRLSYPTDVYIDNNGTIYVADAGNVRVQQIAPNSTNGTTILDNTFGNVFTRIADMIAMRVDSNSSIYILDRTNARITKWPQGSLNGLRVAGGYGSGINTNQMNMASAMFIEPNASIIWIADTNNHRIIRWTSPTTSVFVCGSLGSNGDQFRFPGGLFVDTSDSNKLYVADTENHRIQLWPTGVTSGITVAGMTGQYGTALNQLWRPRTLIVDNNQNMYIVDQSNHRILKWRIGTTAGVIIAGDMTAGVQSSQLNYPININFDSNGSLFVVDGFNHRVQKLSLSCPPISNLSTTTASTTTLSLNATCADTRWSANAVTIAGASTNPFNSISTPLNNPSDVFVDNNNTIYVLDSGNYRVLRFTLNSTYATAVVSGSYGSMLNQFSNMTALHVDADRNVYILDSVNSRVIKWFPSAYVGILVAGGNGAGINVNQLYYPAGMFIATNSSVIWIADTYNHRIVRWSSPSLSTVVCGSYGANADQLNYPKGLFVDASAADTLYIADTNNHRIQRILSGAAEGTTVAGQTSICGNGLSQLCNPTAVIKDSSGYLYIADSSNHRVVRWLIGSSSGTIIAGASTSGTLLNQLYRPNSVKIDSTGALIVADTGNNRVQRFAVACTLTTTTTTTTTTTSTSTSAKSKTTRVSTTHQLHRLFCSVWLLVILIYH